MNYSEFCKTMTTDKAVDAIGGSNLDPLVKFWLIERWTYHVRRETTLVNALRIARMALEQSMPLSGRVAANGPTIAEVIVRALHQEYEDDK